MNRQRFFYSGGSYNNSAYGAASFNGNNSRSNTNTNIGFRAAYTQKPDIVNLRVHFQRMSKRGSFP
jgi:hypothetical protein